MSKREIVCPSSREKCKTSDRCHVLGCVVKPERVLSGADVIDPITGHPQYVELRPVLREFAGEMELKLRKNDHKRGWRELPIEALFRQFLLEVEEFKVADEFLSVAEARKETLDLANFALILWDRLSMLNQDKNRHAQEEQK